MSYFPKAVSADGLVLITDTSSISFHNEQLQVAAINYENGTEKLAIAVKLDPLKNKSIVWIVPVPAKADDVKIDILKNFPEFQGADLAMYADEKTDNIAYLLVASSLTQIYPSIFILPLFSLGYSGSEYEDVKVYSEVQKGGITSQVITANNAESFYNYLKSMNITVEEGSFPVLEEYVEKNYSFVASWVSSVNESDYRMPSIFVEFPSDEIYYPMKPTSVYGDTKVPVLIYIVGLVQPKFYAEIENYTSVRYVDGIVNVDDGMSTFYSGKSVTYISNYGFGARGHGESKRVAYTKIMIGFSRDMWSSTMGTALYWQGRTPHLPETPPAKNFVEDIYLGKPDNIPEVVSAKLFKASLLDAMVSLLGIFIWVLATSVLSGTIAGYVVFRKVKKSAIVSLSNCLSIIALAIATCLSFKKSEGSRLKFIVAFSLIFLVINYLLFAMLVAVMSVI